MKHIQRYGTDADYNDEEEFIDAVQKRKGVAS